jgi:hypothetical protein
MLGTVLDLRSIGEKMTLLAIILLVIVLFAFIVRITVSI